ncbi:MAG: DUF4124 domain-containing protein [Lysobacteraceae bacterium]
MPSVLRHAVSGLAIAAGVLACANSARADEVTIYRCVDARGKVALQDRPCPKDVHQDVRQMVRPQDPPPGNNPVVVAEKPAPRDVEVRIVHDRYPPPPTYRCTTPDGSSYISHTGIPQGRYVPLWTYGYGQGMAYGGAHMHGQAAVPAAGPAPQHRDRFAGSYGRTSMTYVEDTCVRLSQDEVCQAMRDRIDQLGTLFFNGQPSDRERYDRESKGLKIQIRDECVGN